MEEIKTIQEMQEIQLGIMKQIHFFCEERRIRYFLAFGTLIGAVRHNGFIPWDDDIDIMMMREDYDRFLKEFDEWASDKNLYLASPLSKQHYYPHQYSKVCDGRTVLNEKMTRIDPKLGVYIDVFVMDNMPNNVVMRRIFHFKSRVMRRLIAAADTNLENDVYKRHYNIFKQILIRLLCSFPIEKSYSLLEKLSRSYSGKKSEYVTNTESGSGAIYLKKWFDGRKLHDFEGEKFYIPENYDEILKTVYGNYMKLPPKEEQEPHHINDVWYR